MIVAFTGKLGSGKDTAGERMVSMVDLPSRRVSFAAPLKESAAALWDIPVADWEIYKNDPDAKVFLAVGYVDVTEDEHGNIIEPPLEAPNVIREFTVREHLQRYGTESHRDVFGQNFWVEQGSKELNPWGEYEFVYVTDARFYNEAEALRQHGGVIVRVVGDNEETGAHRSESGLPDEFINFIVDNSVRGDNFENLDAQLRSIAVTVGLPLKDSVLA